MAHIECNRFARVGRSPMHTKYLVPIIAAPAVVVVVASATPASAALPTASLDTSAAANAATTGAKAVAAATQPVAQVSATAADKATIDSQIRSGEIEVIPANLGWGSS